MYFIKQKNIGFLGLARSTLSAYEFLDKKGFNLWIWDDNSSIREKYKNHKLNIVNFEDWNFSILDCVVCSPGIPLYYPYEHEIVKYLNEFEVPVTSDVELFFEFFPDCKYIGITGSNGKSTLTTLVYEIFKLSGKTVYMAGNIGIPIFSLENITKDAYIILELSSFQLSYLKNMKLNIACILNIEDNHNEYHGGFSNYQEAKFNIFKNQTAKDYTIIDINENYYTQLINNNSLKINSTRGKFIKVSTQYSQQADYFFNENILCDNFDNNIFSKKQSTLIKFDFTSYLNFKSRSYKQMILFAYVISRLAKISFEVFLEGLKRFKGLIHRQEVIAKIDNIIVINDSKATTPAAAEMALSRFNNIYWLVGGIRKSGNLERCLLHDKNINQVFIFGKDKLSFAKELQGKVKFSCYNNLKDATKAAIVEVQKDKNQIKNEPSIILLSPIGISLDEFSNFEERGEYFKQLIRELLNVAI